MTTSVSQSRFFRSDTRFVESMEQYTVYTCKSEGKIELRDIFLSAGAGIDLDPLPGLLTILVPIVGSLIIHNEQLDPGELYYYPDSNQKTVVDNPEGDTINFLQLSLPMILLPNDASSRPSKATLNLIAKNHLAKADGLAGVIRTGIYDSRTKDELTPISNEGAVFTFVLNGSFEVEGRLLEYRDGLLLWGVTVVELEALSESALLIIVDC